MQRCTCAEHASFDMLASHCSLKCTLPNGCVTLHVVPKGPRYLYSLVDCRVCILGITIMIWGSMPHNRT